jgi:hypothetical protein
MQQNNIAGIPVGMFDKDLYQQIKKWRATRERMILLMDLNGNHLINGLYDKIGRGSDGMEEFTHRCWGRTPPNTHSRGSVPIDGGYISPEIEIINLSMLNFVDSPDNHRSLLLDVSTSSMLGEHLNKICRPVSQRLVTSQVQSVERYNKIFKEQCSIHRIQDCMDAINRMTKYCGYQRQDHSSYIGGAAPGTMCSAAPGTLCGAVPGTLCGAVPGTCMYSTITTHSSPPIGAAPGTFSIVDQSRSTNNVTKQ